MIDGFSQATNVPLTPAFSIEDLSNEPVDAISLGLMSPGCISSGGKGGCRKEHEKILVRRYTIGSNC